MALVVVYSLCDIQRYTHKLFLSLSRKSSVDNRVQICARIIVHEAADMHKRTPECAKLLLSRTLLERVQKCSGLTVNFLKIQRALSQPTAF